MRSVTLHCTTNGSDKIYKIEIVAEGGLFMVRYANGRRGGTMATGIKTQVPVSLDKANAIFEKLSAEKVAKGYVVVGGEAGSGVAVLEADMAGRATGHAPMLCNAIDEAEAQRLMDDPNWMAQRKFDGERRAIMVSGGKVVGINRKGLAVALPLLIAEAAVAIGADLHLDGEQIGDRFFAFDILKIGPDDLAGVALHQRLTLLETLIPNETSGAPITFAVTARTESQKRKLHRDITLAGGEGLVFKYAGSTYQGGRPASGGLWLKHKFTETLSALVSGINDKRSVSLELVEQNGHSIPVGNVTIPPNHTVPDRGAVVEIRYLYAFPGGSLFQPVYLGPRTDIDPSECRADQRKFVAAEKVPA